MYSIGNSPDSSFFLPRTFLIHLFETGNCIDCLYSYVCGRCAIAETRSRLDGSSFYFNFFSLDLTTLRLTYAILIWHQWSELNCSISLCRWLVRSSYSIGNAETYLEDTVLSWCCSCCVINQLYQTTRFYGNPTTDGGAAFNANPMSIDSYNENYWQEFAMAMCCGRYVRAELLNGWCISLQAESVLVNLLSIVFITTEAIGMPFWLGFCNIAPCLARNLLRYQYRLMPESDNDVIEVWVHCNCFDSALWSS